MSINRENFFGQWDVYSGSMHLELVLHDNGSYGEAARGGAQTHWGTWGLEALGVSVVLALRPQASNPAGLLMFVYGSAEPVERHVVVSVAPNQIQFYDGLMVRRFVPDSASAIQGNTLDLPDPADAVAPAAISPAVAGGFFQTPVAAPSPQYSAPAPEPAPVGQSTPLLDRLKNIDPDTQKAINDIYLQMYKVDRETSTNIMAANAALETPDISARETAILNQERATHDFANQFIKYAGSK